MLWIVLAILAVVALIGVTLYNRIIVLENRIKNAWGQIDVQLKRRNDLIPNLLETVRGYAAHERELFTRLGEARERSLHASSVPEQAKASNGVSAALGSVFAVAENYPALKANENFLALQAELSETEDKIAYARGFYNDAVLRFNNAIQTVPGNFVAGPMGKTPQVALETPESEQAVSKTSFA
ncbi:MAG: LemA protein [uncultured Truepera sp.]|uniref:LemA protein n=1 Tax=uncultured Truepera sp. TaxID=543023 RepID=A0A6J4VXG3_9DEIN|nr:MAG: LemA protein [uncultured Truepera sp.]